MRVFTCLCLIGVSMGLLAHWVTIWIYGAVIISEPNKTILTLETIGIVSILAFGIYRAKKELER